MRQNVQSQSCSYSIRRQQARSNTETRSLVSTGRDKAVQLLDRAGGQGAKLRKPHNREGTSLEMLGKVTVLTYCRDSDTRKGDLLVLDKIPWHEDSKGEQEVKE